MFDKLNILGVSVHPQLLHHSWLLKYCLASIYFKSTRNRKN